ncbi:MAG: NAD(P)/FAD-dependent oxidoreductase [Gemmatimonadaceae bacterium]
MSTHEIVDITIVGGGPTGLFGLFYAGMRGVSAQIVDALPQLGGQLTALYPEKYIFDVAGFPKVLAKDLVKALADQALQFRGAAAVHLLQNITGLESVDGSDGDRHFVLTTASDRFPTRALVLAAGIGAFSPRRLHQASAQPWYGRGIHDVVTDPERFRGQRVVIIGGGDSAFDWAQQLLDRARGVTLMHRSDRFRAHAATVTEVQRAAALGRAEVLTFCELHEVRGDGDRLTGISIRHTKTKELREVACDAVLPMLGFVSDIGPLGAWGLTLEKEEIVVNSRMETGRPGIYAAGDVTCYPGKLKLIATGFGEVATAINEAVHWIHPEKKVNPGHSSHMAIFGQTND